MIYTFIFCLVSTQAVFISLDGSVWRWRAPAAEHKKLLRDAPETLKTICDNVLAILQNICAKTTDEADDVKYKAMCLVIT